MQAFNLFIAITLGGVGYGNSLFLVLAQALASAYLVVRTMFTAMRQRSPMVKTMACLIPMVVGGTYILAASIIFGAFFSDTWTSAELLHLVESTLNRNFIFELLGWLGLFALLTIIYTLLYRLKLTEWLLTFSLEILVALALLALYGGLLIDGFPFTILHLCYTNIYWVKLPIYGIFMIIFKNYVLLVSLLIGGMLWERKRPLPTPEDYPNRQSFYEKQAQRFLTTDYLALGIAMFLFGLSASCFFWWIVWNEYHSWPDFNQLSNDERFGMISLVLITLVTMGYCITGLVMIFRRLQPQTSRPYRQLLSIAQSQPDPAAVIELFYQEIVLPGWKNPELSKWKLGLNLQTSPHFLVERKGISVKIKPQGQWTAAAPYAANYKSHTNH